MKTQNPSNLSQSDRELLQKVLEAMDGKQQPMLIGPEGGHLQMPEALFHVLTKATRALLSGQSIQILSQGEELTSQAAACRGSTLGTSPEFAWLPTPTLGSIPGGTKF